MRVKCQACGEVVDRSEADKKMHGGYTCRECFVGPYMPIEVTLVRSSWAAYDDVTSGLDHGDTLSKEMRG